MVFMPFGHQPGVHVPGTVVPIAVAEAGAAARAAAMYRPPWVVVDETSEARERRLAEQAAYERVAQQQREADERRRADLRADMDAVVDPVERLLRAAAGCAERFVVSETSRIGWNPRKLERYFPDLAARPAFSGPSRGVGAWDDVAVAAHLVAHAVAAPPDLVVAKRRRFGGSAHETVPGWPLPEGWLEEDDRGYLDAAVLASGDVVVRADRGGAYRAGEPGIRALNGAALAQVGRLCGYPHDLFDEDDGRAATDAARVPRPYPG